MYVISFNSQQIGHNLLAEAHKSFILNWVSSNFAEKPTSGHQKSLFLRNSEGRFVVELENQANL